MKTMIPDGLIAALASGRRVVVATGLPERGMRTLSILCAFTLLCPAQAMSGDILSDGEDDGAPPTAAVQPAYRFIEGISDGVYDFARRHVAGAVLPDRLTRSLKAAPRRDSAPDFEKNLRENEARYYARARAAYPEMALASGPGADQRMREWQSWAAQEQANVVLSSLSNSLVARYQLELFGEASGRYALDRRNWDADFLSVSTVLGGAFLYVGGMHARTEIGKLKVGLDVSPGLRFQRALQGDGTAANLAGLELGMKGAPVTLVSEWGMCSGHMCSQRVGLSYRARF